jgi:hypothetical protein
VIPVQGHLSHTDHCTRHERDAISVSTACLSMLVRQGAALYRFVGGLMNQEHCATRSRAPPPDRVPDCPQGTPAPGNNAL